MDQKIRNKEHRIILILANIQFNGRTILFYYHTMNGKRDRHPLVFLDTTVIMGVKISKASILIKGILFDIESRRIDMGTKYIHALFHFFLTDMKQGNGFVHPYRINLISLFQAAALFDDLLQFLISCCFCCIYYIIYTFSLCLTVRKEFAVLFIQLFQFLQLFFTISFPYIFLFHFLYSFFMLSGQYPDHSLTFCRSYLQISEPFLHPKPHPSGQR